MRSFLDPGKLVVIDFISTRCISVCSGLSQGFSDLRKELGKNSGSVQLISISTDPDSDGPEQMKEYLARYNAGTSWDFLTGSRADIALMMKTLAVPQGNKMSPLPFYFLRGPKSNEWVHVKGTEGATALLREIRKIEDDNVPPLPINVSQAEESKPTNTLSAVKSHDAMMQLVPVKGGCYQMGDSRGADHEYVKPVHEVCLDGFSMGKYDVTVGEFKIFVADTGHRTEAEKGGGCYGWTGSKWKKKRSMTWRNAGFAQDDRHPVVCVSWNDSLAFAEWLSAKTGKKYRLPNEAEWEYAARSGGKNEQYAGFSGEGRLFLYADFCDKNCVFDHKTPSQDDGYPYTAPAGSYKPNGLGLHDMTGNVWEWLSDWYGATYYAESTKDNPKGPAIGEYRVLRGGSWLYEPLNLRATHRFFSTPSMSFNDIGFRLVSPGP